MDEKKLSSIVSWQTPSTVRDLQVFLGFANFYLRFISNFSEIVSPLTKLLSKNSEFKWTMEQQRAFDLLKKHFTTAPVLRIPDPSLQFIVETDASDFAIGAVLSQRIPSDANRLHPCAYFSRSMSPAERNYGIGDKELLAVKSAFEEWRHYLEGARHPVIVFTDHKNLAELQKKKSLSQRQARWQPVLQ